VLECWPEITLRAIPNALAAVLGRQEQPGQMLTDTILAHLRTRELLLVLDNRRT
jgi:hypothetical protein